MGLAGLLLEDEVLQLGVRGLQVIVDNGQVVGTRAGVFQLGKRRVESLFQRLRGLGASARQSLSENVHRGGGHEQEAGVEVCVLDRLDPLHVDVQYARLAALGHVVHGLDRRAVVVARKLRPLDELVVLDHGLELVHADKIVVPAVHLAGPGRSCR